MKAIQYKAFGGSDVIELVEIPVPSLENENDVLIQVYATSVNPLDMKIRSGILQQIRPVEIPFIPGSDAAGVVMAIGSKVTKFSPGDEVVVVANAGTYAEYMVANEHMISLKPTQNSFQEASSVAVNVCAALSVLFTEGGLKKGQKILIQGAAGAVGAAMVQMAKDRGAYVIATASGKGIDLVKGFGADEVVDYKVQDVTRLVKDVDLIADCAGGSTQAKLFDVLKVGGKLLSIVEAPDPQLAEQHKVEARFVFSDLSEKSLAVGLKKVKWGKLKPIVTTTFRLEDAALAQDFVSAGGVNGKVVLQVG